MHNAVWLAILGLIVVLGALGLYDNYLRGKKD